MIYDLAVKYRWPINDRAAFYLLLGIMAESGGLGFYPISVKTLRKLVKLIRSNDDLMRVAYIIRRWEDISDIHAYGALLKLIKRDRRLGLVYGVWGQGHLRGSELAVRAVHETMFLKGYTIMFILRTVPDSSEWYCSLRGSKENQVDLNVLASYFGGGGHFNSAGFKSSETSATIIRQIKQRIRQARKIQG
jgi:nanoRNase/pAp phosphatase (c-di-AMP/oligoRNAs hydrolase)